MIIRVIPHDVETGDREYEDYDSYADLAYKLDDYDAGDLIENLYRYKPYLFKEILGDCGEKD